MSFTLYPAIDVREGAIVRLRQGDYQAQTRYPLTPLQQAMAYARQGAQWLHLVDLDAARTGGYGLLPLLRQIVAETGLKVQTGGGVRTAADVEAMLEAGASRVVIGSLAVRATAEVRGWLARFGAEQLTLALDTRQDADGQWRLPLHGWTQSSPHTLFALADDYAEAGLLHLLCTDIARDGMLAGPNIDLYQALCRAQPGLAVQASGGIRGLADIAQSRLAGCAGAVLGKALLEQHFTLPEALTC